MTGSLGPFFVSRSRQLSNERITIAMKIEIREANTSTPERPLWVWNVWWGSRDLGKGFCKTEKEAKKQASLAVSRANLQS
jgi:hypothetical protein